MLQEISKGKPRRSNEMVANRQAREVRITVRRYGEIEPNAARVLKLDLVWKIESKPENGGVGNRVKKGSQI